LTFNFKYQIMSALNKANTLTGLQEFNARVIENARGNLSRLGKNASNALSKSIVGEAIVSDNSISNSISMEDYGIYQDQGVSGTKKKYNTPFKYTNKQPPVGRFSKWSIRRGLAPRSKSGQFQNRRSLQFALARHIYEQGIKPTHFFTDAFNEAFNLLPDEIVEKYGLDVENFLKLTFENGSKT